ncbi:MAG: hypothetical protein Q9160_001072 [Pyrenula sp. 1 TL-2023]
MLTASTLLSLLTTALAITITSPPASFTQDTTQPQRITWTSVSTDPSTLTIQLVNLSKFPNYNKTLATGISTSTGFFINPANNDDSQTGTGFQINLLGAQGPSPAGILAQSQQFTLVNGAGSSSSSSSSRTTSGTTLSSSTPRSSSGTTTPRPSSGTSVPFPSTSSSSGNRNGTVTSGTARPSGAAAATGASGTARSSGAPGSGTARSSSASASGSARPSQFNGTANALERGVGVVAAAAVGMAALFV